MIHFQLKAYYDGESGTTSEMIPGMFLHPNDAYYGLDLFMEIEVYDMLCDIVQKLKLSAEDQLKIVLSALNMSDIPSKHDGPAVRAEIIDLRDGSVVASAEED